MIYSKRVGIGNRVKVVIQRAGVRWRYTVLTFAIIV